MRYKFMFLGLFTASVATSQELRLTSGIGYAIGELQDQKKIMLASSASTSIAVDLKWNTSITFSPGISTVKYSSTGPNMSDQFHSTWFFNLPLSVRKYYFLSKKSKLFMDLGANAGYLFLDKIETSNGTDVLRTKQKRLGWNFGVLSGFGLKTVFSKRVFFEIGTSRIDDLLIKYKAPEDELKLKTRMLVTTFSIEL